MLVSQMITRSVMVFGSWQVLYGKLRSAWICHSMGQLVSVLLYNFHDNLTSGRSDKNILLLLLLLLYYEIYTHLHNCLNPTPVWVLSILTYLYELPKSEAEMSRVNKFLNKLKTDEGPCTVLFVLQDALFFLKIYPEKYVYVFQDECKATPRLK